MKRTVCALLLLTAMLFPACMPAAQPAVQPESPSAAPSAGAPEVASFSIAATPEVPGATCPPSMVQTPTATPAPTAPPAATAASSIQAEWYTQRNSDLMQLMKQNGSFLSDDALLAALAKMEIDPDKPMVALTFDDGPTAGVTGTILDVLEKYNGRATFFVVGSRIAGNESLLKRAVALGCEIGNHTWDHVNLKEANGETAIETIQRTNQAVFDATGYVIKSLRPPEGASNDSVKALAGTLNMSVVFWSHSTHDYRIKSAEKIASLVFYDTDNDHTLRDGDIVLMHDLRSYTADAMEAIVSRLVAEGYQLVTVQELLQLSDNGFLPGKSYKRQ